jgi:DNA-binding Lrp family transcriptional regulator
MSNQRADLVFEALGEPARRRIVELISDGPTPVGQLAERLNMGRPGVSKHLKVLENAGLVAHHSVGTRNLYVLVPGAMSFAQEWIGSMWDTALVAYAHEVRRSNDGAKSKQHTNGSTVKEKKDE